MEHHEELVQYARDNNIWDHVTFIRSFSDADKRALIGQSTGTAGVLDAQRLDVADLVLSLRVLGVDWKRRACPSVFVASSWFTGWDPGTVRGHGAVGDSR